MRTLESTAVASYIHTMITAVERMPKKTLEAVDSTEHRITEMLMSQGFTQNDLIDYDIVADILLVDVGYEFPTEENLNSWVNGIRAEAVIQRVN